MGFENNEDEKKAIPDTPEIVAKKEEIRLMKEAIEEEELMSAEEEASKKPDNKQVISEAKDTEDLKTLRTKMDLPIDNSDILSEARAKGLIIDWQKIGTDPEEDKRAMKIMAEQRKKRGKELYAAADKHIAELNANTPEKIIDSSKIPIDEILNMSPEEIMDLSNEVIENLTNEERMAIRKKLGTI